MNQNTLLIAKTQPNARIEKVVAVCALTTHTAPRIVNRIPNTRNQPHDFLTSSIPAINTSESFVIVMLPSHTEYFRNCNRPRGLGIRAELPKDQWMCADMPLE